MKSISDSDSVPETTYIYISKTRMYVKILVGAIFLITAVVLYFNEPVTDFEVRRNNIIMYASPLFGLMFLYQAYRGLKNKEPQMILSDEGLQVPGKPLMLWRDISDINLKWGSVETLSFQYKGKMTTIATGNIGVKPTAFTNLIDAYRLRNYQKSIKEGQI